MKKALSFFTAISAAVCMLSAGAGAQTLESSYFLDNYTFNYRVNPALMPDNNFIAIGIGNITAGIESKCGVGSFLYPGTGGKLVTGLNSSVSSSDFLSKFTKGNKIGENINVNLLSFGIRKEKSMTTVEVNIREDFADYTPKDLFAFLKDGSSNAAYDLSSLGAGANAMVELALGHTRKFGKLVVGLRAKFLFGAAAGSIGFDKFDLISNQSALGIDATGKIKIACKPLELYGTNDNPLYVNDVKFSLQNLGTAGFGVGFDLGAKWYIDDNLSVTLGVNDLGGVSWKYNNVLATQLSTTFNGLADLGTDTDVEKALSDYWEQVVNSARLTQSEDVKEFEALPFNINAGVRYRMPFYNRLSVGLVTNYSHSKYDGCFSGRVGATITPLNWFSLTGNIGYSNYSGVTGCMASITLGVINIFAGFDGYMGKFSEIRFKELDLPLDPNLPIQSLRVPLNSFRYKFSAGINLQFGKRKADYIKAKEAKSEK